MKPLVVIPAYMSEESDMEVLGECVQSIRHTVSNTVDILIVDDRSPQPWLVDVFESRLRALRLRAVRKPENEGFSRTVNVGLERARDEGREAVLMNADIVMRTPGWLARCRKTTGVAGQAGRARRRAAALPERPDPARRPLLLEARRTSSSTASASRPATWPRRRSRRSARSPARSSTSGREVLEQVGPLRPGLPDGRARTSTTACASSRPASSASTSPRSAPSTTSRCSARGRARRSCSGRR